MRNQKFEILLKEFQDIPEFDSIQWSTSTQEGILMCEDLAEWLSDEGLLAQYRTVRNGFDDPVSFVEVDDMDFDKWYLDHYSSRVILEMLIKTERLSFLS